MTRQGSAPAQAGRRAEQCARASRIRAGAMDRVGAARSGHARAPMGMAQAATVLRTRPVTFDFAAADGPGRGRFLLSNGGASMLVCALLHLTGLRDTNRDPPTAFRHRGARTAGHPEYGHAAGIETPAGPPGQGLANGAGMAMAGRWPAARFGDARVDRRTRAFCGDGCPRQVISRQAISLASHPWPGKPTVLHDDNGIPIDGATSRAFTRDVPARFVAAGWHLQSRDVTRPATRTEIAPAVAAAGALPAEGVSGAAVPMPSWKLFQAQPEECRVRVPGRARRVAVEAADRFGRTRHAAWDADVIGPDGPGALAHGPVRYRKFGITAAPVAARARAPATH